MTSSRFSDQLSHLNRYSIDAYTVGVAPRARGRRALVEPARRRGVERGGRWTRMCSSHRNARSRCDAQHGLSTQVAHSASTCSFVSESGVHQAEREEVEAFLQLVEVLALRAAAVASAARRLFALLAAAARAAKRAAARSLYRARSANSTARRLWSPASSRAPTRASRRILPCAAASTGRRRGSAASGGTAAPTCPPRAGGGNAGGTGRGATRRGST